MCIRDRNTARLLIDDLHLVVHHHVFDIFLEHRVCLQQLDDRMHAVSYTHLDVYKRQALRMVSELHVRKVG